MLDLLEKIYQRRITISNETKATIQWTIINNKKSINDKKEKDDSNFYNN